MKRHYIICEGPLCTVKQQTKPELYGGHGPDWICVSRSISNSTDVIASGEHHFCSDKCLAAFMATRNTVPAHDWPKPIPGRRGKEVQCKRCGRYSNEGDGPCVPAKRGESEVRS